jgi:hypothetical protein
MTIEDSVLLIFLLSSKKDLEDILEQITLILGSYDQTQLQKFREVKDKVQFPTILTANGFIALTAISELYKKKELSFSELSQAFNLVYGFKK